MRMREGGVVESAVVSCAFRYTRHIFKKQSLFIVSPLSSPFVSLVVAKLLLPSPFLFPFLFFLFLFPFFWFSLPSFLFLFALR